MVKKLNKASSIKALTTALEIGEQVYHPGGKLLIVFKMGKLALKLF